MSDKAKKAGSVPKTDGGNAAQSASAAVAASGPNSASTTDAANNPASAPATDAANNLANAPVTDAAKKAQSAQKSDVAKNLDSAQKSEKLYAGMTRRTLCAGVGGLAAMLVLGCVKFLPQTAVVRPPGGQDEDLLFASCMRCGRCIEECPRHVVKLSHIEDGLIGARMPQMNFEDDYCDFCEQEHGGIPKCIAACSTGALGKKAEAIDVSKVRIGCANLVQDWCLAYHDTGCRTCYEACPYDAMALDNQGRPYVLEDKCNGCGACEAACVSLTNGSLSLMTTQSRPTSRAITVKPINNQGKTLK